LEPKEGGSPVDAEGMDTMTAPSRSGERWIAVGQSNQADARAAGAAAARQALDGGAGRLLVVFCSDSYDLAALLAGINETSFPPYTARSGAAGRELVGV
jgi:hypothetical protein